MNIVVCCKFVPCLQDMEVGADHSVHFDRAEWQISEYDLQAVEAGVQLAKVTGGKLVAVSVGSKRIETTQLRKDLLSRGPEELYLITDNALECANTAEISSLLAEAVKKIGADVVLCGEGSADYYYQQTGLQLGEKLGWNCLNGVDSITAEAGGLLVDRVLETETETVSVPVPAVLSVTTGINVPPRPNMRAILAAGKKPVTIWAPGELTEQTASATEIVSTVAPDSVDRKGIVIGGTLEEATAELVRLLKTESAL